MLKRRFAIVVCAFLFLLQAFVSYQHALALGQRGDAIGTTEEGLGAAAQEIWTVVLATPLFVASMEAFSRWTNRVRRRHALRTRARVLATVGVATLPLLFEGFLGARLVFDSEQHGSRALALMETVRLALFVGAFLFFLNACFQHHAKRKFSI